MFRRVLKNHSIQTTSKLVRDTPTDDSSPIIEDLVDPMLGPEIAAAYAEVAKDFITHTALVVGGTIAAVSIIRRICK